MLFGLREVFGAMFRFWDDHISADGAWWILALDSVLLIPLIFAVFFYPMEVLIGVGAVLMLIIAVLMLRRAIHVRQPHV